MENWIYYKLQSRKNTSAELIGCIDLCTLDDDEFDAEYMRNDGIWIDQMPDYWTNEIGKDCTSELMDLKEVHAYEWETIRKLLKEAEGSIEVFEYEFDNARLYVSYDRDEIYDA